MPITENILDSVKWNQILNRRKKISAPGIDGITYEMLKEIKPDLRDMLITELNDMWRTGRIDQSLKIIKVVPIPKPGRDPEIVDNLRPIAMLNCTLKVINTAVLNEIENHLSDRKILPENSFGFRKHRSTSTALSYITNRIANIKRRRKIAAIVFIDLSNAYNSVITSTLEGILHRNGMPPEICAWIYAFLTDRQVQVQTVSGTVTRTVNDGLPQGDVMSPTLFNVYTITLHNIQVEGVELVQFADVFSILIEGDSIEMVNHRAQKFVDMLSVKANELNLKINPDKTKAMLFQMNNKTLNIKINNMAIETVNVHRYLGLNFDRSFKFGAHIREIKKGAMDRMNMLKVISSNRSGGHPQTMGMIYNAIIRGYLDYGSSVYANASKTNLQALTITNNAGLRKVTGCTKTTPINTLCAIASQPPLEYRRELVAAKEITRHAQFGSPVWNQLENMRLNDIQDKTMTYLETIFLKYKDIFEQISMTVTVKENLKIEVG